MQITLKQLVMSPPPFSGPYVQLYAESSRDHGEETDAVGDSEPVATQSSEQECLIYVATQVDNSALPSAVLRYLGFLSPPTGVDVSLPLQQNPDNEILMLFALERLSVALNKGVSACFSLQVTR